MEDTIEGLPILKKTAPATDEGLPIFKKKPIANGADLSGSSLTNFQPQQNGYSSETANSILSKNKNIDWVKRLYEKNAPSIQVHGESNRSTHLMSDDGNGYVFPTVVRQNGKLVHLSEDQAYDYAKKTKTGIQLQKDQGTWFAANGYKTGTGVNNDIGEDGIPVNNPNYSLPGTGYSDLIPVLPNNREVVRQRQVQDKQALSNRLKSLSTALDPEHRKAFDKAQEIASARPQDQLRQSSDAEVQDYKFDQNPVGKVLNSVNYLSSKATKGVLQIAKGAAYLADNHMSNGMNEPLIDEAFKKAYENTNFGLSKGTIARKEENPITANLGGLAEFLPSAAAASGTGGATLYLQGLGQGKEVADAAEKQSGTKLDPTVKHAFILGTGAVNGLLMGELGSSMFKSLPAGLRGDIAASITADAVKEAADKEITGEAFKSILDKGAQKFADKLAKGGIATLEGYKHAVTNLGALTTANFALKKAADTANDAPVFNENLGDLASGLNDVATKQAPFFSIPAALGAATKLTPYSEYKNSVVESLMHDNSPENVERTKQELANHGYQQGWRTEDIEKTISHVDEIAKIAKSLPKDIPDHKIVDAVDLVQGRNRLQEELAKTQSAKEELDPALKDIVPAGEQMLADKVEQANDKLKSIATGSKTTYSKGIGEEEGKFFKTVEGKKEEITPERYALEALERDSRKQSEKEIDDKLNNLAFPELKTAKRPEGKISMDVIDGGLKFLRERDASDPEVINDIKKLEDYKSKVENILSGKSTANEPAPVRRETSPVVESKQEQPEIKAEDSPKAVEPVVAEKAPAIETVRQKAIDTKETRAEQPETTTENKSPANPKQEVSSPSQGDTGYSTKAGDPLRSFAETIRKGKISKLGGFKAGTGFDTVWDGSLEVVALAAEGGAKIADAIESGLKHVKESDWYKNLNNKAEFDKQYREHLANEYKEVEKTRPSKNEETGERAAELGVDLKEAKETTRSEDVVETEATDKIKKGYDVHDLIDRIVNDKHAATDTEVAILNKYIDAKENEIRGYNERLATDGATMGKKAFIDLMQAKTQAEVEFQDAADANRKTGRVTAQALNARKFRFNKENSLENMVAKKREALGGEKLTPEQLADITKKFSEMENIQKQLEARVKKVEEQNAKLKAEQTVKRTVIDRSKQRKATQGELATERSKIYEDLRDEFKKIRQSGQAMSDIPYRREFAAIAKHMPALLRNLAQDGLVRIEDVVDNLYSTFKEDLPEITKLDIADLIAGKYNEKKETKTDLQDNIRSLRTQAKLVAEIERLEKGIKTDKPEVVKKKNETVEALRSRLKQLNDESGELSLAALKKRLQEGIDKTSKRIADGDFSKEEPRKPVTPDKEAIELRRKYDRVKQEWDIEVAKDALKQRSKVEKLKDDLLNIASLPRALKASLDFSAVLRQGLFLTPAHPKEALSAFKEMFRQTFSEERYKNWISDLKHSEHYELMKQSDLYLSDKNDPKLIAREEEFTSNLADKIPGIGKAIAASERAYTGYLNVLRAGVFEKQAEELIRRGYTFENNPEVFKGMAKVVNVLTGRGDIPEVLGGKSPKVLSNVLFSPRFMAARIQTLYLWADPRLPREAKLMAAKDIGATLGTGAALLSLAALAGFKVNLDPRSSQFMKIEDENDDGSTYYDIMGGLPQYVRLLSQLATGTTVSAAGNETDLSAPRGKDNPWGQTRGDVELKFMRGKLSPVVGSAINLQEGRDVVGNQYNFFWDVPMEFVPLPFTDVSEAYKVGGIGNALKVLAPSQFGIGVSSYQPKK